MGSTHDGTEKSGFALGDDGPFRCSNCTKWKDGVCGEKEVADDPSIPDRKNRLMANGKIRTSADECCNYIVRPHQTTLGDRLKERGTHGSTS